MSLRNMPIEWESQNLRHTTSGGPALASAMIREANWSRFNFYSGMYPCRRQKNTSDVSNDSGTPSMIGSALSHPRRPAGGRFLSASTYVSDFRQD